MGVTNKDWKRNPDMFDDDCVHIVRDHSNRVYEVFKDYSEAEDYAKELVEMQRGKYRTMGGVNTSVYSEERTEVYARGRYANGLEEVYEILVTTRNVVGN